MADRSELLTLLDFALELAHAAEPVILSRYRNPEVSRKADGTEVTDADRGAEEVMRELIGRRYPGHAVLGEEFGASGAEDAEWHWVLDPIDGTASFSLGVPLFGTLVGLLWRGKPVVGVVHLPAIGETLYAAAGEGCWFQLPSTKPAKVRVRPVDRLEDAVVMAPAGLSSPPPRERETAFRRMLPLIARARKFRFGGDCLQHVVVCRGLAHAAIDPVMHPWDIAALVPCVEEAGGVVSTVDGRRENVVFGESLVSCCGEALLQQVLDVVRPPLSVVREAAGANGPRTTENG
jgi:histidinol-phosphatase